MADLLKFKHGLQANMTENSPALTPGTVYITRDERAMYVDLPAYTNADGSVTEAAKRIRIGDMRVYTYISDLRDELRNDMSTLTTSALFYAEKDRIDDPEREGEQKDITINALLKWDGTKFIQLNKTSDLAANLDSLESRISIVENTVTGLETKVEALENAADDYATKVELGDAVDDLTELIGTKVAQSTFNELSGTVTTLTETVNSNKTTTDTALEGITNSLNAEIERATKAEEANLAKINTNIKNIETNTKAIEVLNGDDKISGSVAKQVKDAVDAEAETRSQAINGLQGSLTIIEGDIGDIQTKNEELDAEIDRKVNKAQGNTNVNKIMITDDKGDIVPGAAVADKLIHLSNVTSDINNQFSTINGSISTINGQITGLTTSLEGIENDLDEYKDAVNETYLSKTDAGTTYLSKTDAETTYATKEALTNTQTALLGEANYNGSIKGAYVAANTALTKAEEGVKKADKAQQDITNYIASNDQALANVKTTADNAATDAHLQTEIQRATKAEEDLTAAITAETSTREQAINDLDDRLEDVEAFFKTAAGETLDTALDTLKEIQDYLNGEGDATGGLIDRVATNANDIGILEGRMDTAEDDIDTLQTELSGAITVLEGAVTGAINTAKSYTDDALTWGTF